MSQFPAIRPSGRSFMPGMLPVNSFASISGKETRVIMGDTMHGHSITLAFQNIQEPTVKRITDHWYDRQGTALAFTLPSAVWAGWDQYADAVATTQQWRYVGQPEIESVSPGVLNVELELVALA